MQRYYKSVSDGYIIGIGIGMSDEEITQEEYNTVLSAIHSKPARTDTTDYKLREDLTWEPYSVEPPSGELDAEEALAIIMGGEAE